MRGTGRHEKRKGQAMGEKLSDYQIRAADAVLNFSEAMTQGSLSIADLMLVLPQAIGGGWDMLEIQLSMLGIAIKEIRKG